MKRDYYSSDISSRIVSRLTLYLGILKELKATRSEINSIELAEKMNTTAVQVRKDLSTFGEFGTRGKGYNISNLIKIIESILGIDIENEIILVGFGKVGTMIAYNNNVLGKGFKLVGVFEKDPQKIGHKIEDSNIVVQDIKEMNRFINMNKINIAILTVNSEYAQETANNLIKSGIKAILNMTAFKLEVSDEISVLNVDISAKLQELNFWRLHPGKDKGGIDLV